jgi:hypothetical protein
VNDTVLATTGLHRATRVAAPRSTNSAPAGQAAAPTGSIAHAPVFVVQWREQPATAWRDVCERHDANEAFDCAEDIERSGGEVKVVRRWVSAQACNATAGRPQ